MYRCRMSKWHSADENVTKCHIRGEGCWKQHPPQDASTNNNPCRSGTLPQEND